METDTVEDTYHKLHRILLNKQGPLYNQIIAIAMQPDYIVVWLSTDAQGDALTLETLQKEADINPGISIILEEDTFWSETSLFSLDITQFQVNLWKSVYKKAQDGSILSHVCKNRKYAKNTQFDHCRVYFYAHVSTHQCVIPVILIEDASCLNTFDSLAGRMEGMPILHNLWTEPAVLGYLSDVRDKYLILTPAERFDHPDTDIQFFPSMLFNHLIKEVKDPIHATIILRDLPLTEQKKQQGIDWLRRQQYAGDSANRFKINLQRCLEQITPNQ